MRTRAPIPSLLATSAVHHWLARAGKRMRSGLIVETGEAREVADLALLVGYGAGAVNPYLAFEAIDALDADAPRADRGLHYVHALDKGLLKVMSKMGISCLSSYQGAQIFEAIGIGPDVISRFFPGTASRIGGIGLREIASEALLRHAGAFDVSVRDAQTDEDAVDVGGVYAWRVGGERHLWNPHTVAASSKGRSTRRCEGLRGLFAGDQRARRRALYVARLLGFCVHASGRAPGAGGAGRQIVRRFATGAMSFGSISREAHENLAIAMNRIGGSPTAAKAARTKRGSSLCPTATAGGAPSSRSPVPASESRRTTLSTPTSSRSKSRREPNQARAASSPDTRSTSTSRGCGTRFRA